MRFAQFLAMLVVGATSLTASMPAHAQDVLAGEPFDVSVTVYRDPNRREGGFDLDYLQGFALITESRRVVLQPGEHRLRFEGVADGIEPVSAIVTGLPSGVIEKNRDAMLLSPSALIASAETQGGRVLLTRANPATGAITRSQSVIRSGADGGVVVETPDGIEALRCSGMAETFAFESAGTGLSARPTLSVFTRTTQRIEAVVQLSYLSRGFDWATDYVVDMKSGGKMDLGAWVTLANGNGTGFANARVQIVAGRLNRDTGEVEPIDFGQPILAYCWPQGSTSDASPPITIERAYPFGFGPGVNDYTNFAPGLAYSSVVVTAQRRKDSVEDAAVAVETMSEAEDLGDLKLYRVPDRATVSSRQSKQVRLLDAANVPIAKIYETFVSANRQVAYQPMTMILRTRNDEKNELGMPLPSGRVSVFERVGGMASGQRLLSAETGLRDIAVNEETEFRLGQSPDVQIRQIEESRELTAGPRREPPFVPNVDRRVSGPYQETSLIEVTNARPFAIQAEVRLMINGGQRLMRADRPVEQKNGQPMFHVTVPANGSVQIRYQTATQ